MKHLIFSFHSFIPGGTISITAYHQDKDIILEIQDQGSGMPANILENIGHPFLTTKENGTGSV